MRLSVYLLLLAAACAAILLPNAAGAQAQPRQHGIFLDSVDVNLINLEVVVTRDGEPVTDLTRDDFEIYDDGKPMEVTNFYQVRRGRRIDEPIEGGYDDPAIEETVPAMEEAITVIVIVDHQFISAPSRKKVFAALRGRLDDLFAANAQVMVVEKDSQVQVRQPLTTDAAEVLAALSEIENTMGSGAMLQANTRWLIRNVTQSALPGEDMAEIDYKRTFQDIRSHASQVYSSVSRSTRLLNAFIGSLAGIEGKKAVIYVSDSLPRFPAEIEFRLWFEKYGAGDNSDLGAYTAESTLREFDTEDMLLDLAANANASQVTFYPVSAMKSGAQRFAAAEFKGGLLSPGFASINDPVTDDGLTLISVATGGTTALGSPNLDWIVDRLRDDLSNYYSLGYPAPHRGDDRNHDVKVEVPRKGVRVRYLHSYRDKSPNQQMQDRTAAALLHDRLENPLGVRMAVGEGERGDKKTLEVPVAVRIPISKLVLIPEGEIRKGQVTLFFAVRDGKGRYSQPGQVVVPIRVGSDKPEGVEAQNAVYATKLLMRPGAQTIAVGVRDDVGQVSSAISRHVVLNEQDG